MPVVQLPPTLSFAEALMPERLIGRPPEPEPDPIAGLPPGEEEPPTPLVQVILRRGGW